eukprot:1475122-Rhodomonas_salina.1
MHLRPTYAMPGTKLALLSYQPTLRLRHARGQVDVSFLYNFFWHVPGACVLVCGSVWRVQQECVSLIGTCSRVTT